MRFRVHVIAVVLSLMPASLAQSKACDVLPVEVARALGQRFPDWRPKEISDLSEYDRKLWLEMHHKECPGVAQGHFEQPDQIAYAVLLIPKAGHTASYKVVVLSKAIDGYAIRILDHAESSGYSDSGLIISKAQHGTYSEFDDTKSVRLKLDGINVEWLEKGSVLYYWSHNKYRSVETGD